MLLLIKVSVFSVYLGACTSIGVGQRQKWSRAKTLNVTKLGGEPIFVYMFNWDRPRFDVTAISRMKEEISSK
jgi:hypothetical protein